MPFSLLLFLLHLPCRAEEGDYLLARPTSERPQTVFRGCHGVVEVEGLWDGRVVGWNGG